MGEVPQTGHGNGHHQERQVSSLLILQGIKGLPTFMCVKFSIRIRTNVALYKRVVFGYVLPSYWQIIVTFWQSRAQIWGRRAEGQVTTRASSLGHLSTCGDVSSSR